MLIISNLLGMDKKVLAYNFISESGLDATAAKTGYTGSKISTSLLSWPGLLISIALGFIGVIFLALTVYGGIMWMTAEGQEEKVEKAKKIVVQSVTGLVIVFAAYAVSIFIVSALSPSTIK
jgi:hypothetical protein